MLGVGKDFMWKVSYVTESIPLSAALRVQRVCIVEDDVFGHFFDVVLEGLTMECRWVRNVQRKTAGGSWPSLMLA